MINRPEFDYDRQGDFDDDDTIHGVSWTIPLPPPRSASRRKGVTDSTTPLLGRFFSTSYEENKETNTSNGDGIVGADLGGSSNSRRRSNNRPLLPANLLLFGESGLLSPSRRQRHDNNTDESDTDDDDGDASEMVNLTTSSIKLQKRSQRSSVRRRRPEGLAGYFFGFMYEEDDMSQSPLEIDGIKNDEGGGDDDEATGSSSWNQLNLALFAFYSLTTAATTLPVLLIPTIGQELLSQDSENGDGDISAFTSRCASSAVLGMACGKLLNAPLPDVMGARRTSTLCSVLLAMPLLLLSISSGASTVATACFLVEFVQSVQWPCIIVLLSVHYNLPHHKLQYESGIYLMSIASRLGSLVAIPLFSTLLRHLHWRVVCLVGAWMSVVGSSVMYLCVMDSPTQINAPQNALQPHLVQQLMTLDPCNGPRQSVVVSSRVLHSVVTNNLLPSFRHVLTSGTFWIIALAHTGSSLVLSSQRILGTYFHDTSLGYLPDAQTGNSLVVFLPLGTILGLAVAGNLFAHRKGKQRKRLVTRLYVVAIVSCYALAILSIPRLRHFVDSPELILFCQIVASFGMGFGIAVMSSVIPGLVSAAFGNHRGFYTSYTDGVAYGLSSVVWRIVATSVEYGNPEGGGWAYGWAAVALLIVLSAILLVECWPVLPAVSDRSRPRQSSSVVQI